MNEEDFWEEQKRLRMEDELMRSISNEENYYDEYISDLKNEIESLKEKIKDTEEYYRDLLEDKNEEINNLLEQIEDMRWRE